MSRNPGENISLKVSENFSETDVFGDFPISLQLKLPNYLLNTYAILFKHSENTAFLFWKTLTLV